MGLNTWNGLGYGLAAGLGIGIILGTTYKGSDASLAAFGGGVILLTLGGALLGAVVGTFITTYDTYNFRYKTIPEK